MNPEIVGWASTGILIVPPGRQVHPQWKTRSTAGVSRWLFNGQSSTSVCFVVYGALLGKAVFIASNVFLPPIAVVGQCLLIANRRRERDGSQPTAAT